MSTPQINMIEMIKLKVMMGLGGGEQSDSIFSLIMIFIISLIEQNFNIIWITIQKKFDQRYQSIVANIIESTNDKFSIYLEKDFSKENKNSDDKDTLILEAILHNISEKYNIKSVMYFKNLYVINFFEQFNIEDNIFAKLHKLECDSEFKISHIKIQLSSDVLTVSELRKYIDKCYDVFKRKIQNNLGSELYFFDQKCANTIKNIDGEIYQPFVKFEYNKFTSNRNFSNIFGENIQVLKKRVNFFKNNKKWYDEKGIPYTFGALLYGVAGTGKTSVIKAIANECNRHIINVNLASIKTNTQLKNLFYCKNIHCQGDFQDIVFDIDINEKIFVIEDIDCMSDVVLDRNVCSTNINDLPDSIVEHKELVDITCEDCLLGHHENHCYSVLKKFCPYCSNMNKNINNCMFCKDPFKHCGIEGHCENFLSVDKPRLCTHCLDNKNREKIKMEVQELNTGSNLATYKPSNKKEEKENKDLITLSSLLNILDGTLELPGRMIIITSNFPEKLDKALIRPGRIDIILNLGRASLNTIKEMYESFYSIDMSQEILIQLKDIEMKFTPAEVNCIFFNNFNEPKMALQKLLEEVPDLTKFIT